MSDLAGGVVDEQGVPWSESDASRGGTSARGMKLRFIDAIWRMRGELPLDPPLSTGEAFARLDPLFQTPGTTYDVDGDTLTYSKRNPGAQDKLATFTSGYLQVEQRGQSAFLRYDLSSTALMLCFLAPLLFLAFAQLAVAANAWEKSSVEATEAAKKGKEKDKIKPVRKLNPVDEFFGAPTPEDPNKEKDKKKDEGRHSPNPGYALAGLFFLVYLVGRWLEPWLIRRQLRQVLATA